MNEIKDYIKRSQKAPYSSSKGDLTTLECIIAIVAALIGAFVLFISMTKCGR